MDRKTRLITLLGGCLIIAVWLLLMREAEGPKTGIADYFAPVAVTETGSLTTATLNDPDKRVPVIRALIAGNPNEWRLSEVAREFAAAEGFPPQQQDQLQGNIAVSPTASFVIERGGIQGTALLTLYVHDKAMGEVPALRPFFDRLVAKLREAFPDNAIEEVD
jgi:hypothetical protein